jgi:Alternative complex III, ActD subunit
MPTLLGVFAQPDHIAAAARRLIDRGYDKLETYTPAPFPEVDDVVVPKPSPVRRFTLVGGLLGVVTGYALTLWMANNWQIMVGGKPFSSVTPYTIIAFELTILFGGVLTVIGLFIVAGLPRFKLDRAYSARFSAEEFGLTVRCQERDVAEIDALLRDHHATEVSLVEG